MPPARQGDRPAGTSTACWRAPASDCSEPSPKLSDKPAARDGQRIPVVAPHRRGEKGADQITTAPSPQASDEINIQDCNLLPVAYRGSLSGHSVIVSNPRKVSGRTLALYSMAISSRDFEVSVNIHKVFFIELANSHAPM